MSSRFFTAIGFILAYSAIINSANISTDSVATKGEKETNLKELVVEAVSRKDIPGGTAFYPLKRDKKFATDAISLIEMMAITELPYDPKNKAVTDAAGNKVNYFIDGKAATPSDLKSLLPKNVVKIEYFPMPTESNFMGQLNVVNYVTKKYISGGYTKIDAKEYLNGTYGKYSISSRLAYKEMTYDFYVDGNHVNNDDNTQDGLIEYRDVEYSGSFYEKITERFETEQSHYKKYGLAALMKADWSHNNLNLTTTAGWNWERIPVNNSDNSTFYSPELINSSSYYSAGSSLGINPYVRLNMDLQLPSDQSLNMTGGFNYARHHSNSLYAPQNITEIINSNKDTRTNIFLMASYSKSFNNRNALNVNLFLGDDNSRTNYSGSSSLTAKYEEFSSELSTTFTHIFKTGRSLSAKLGFSDTERWIEGKRKSVFDPNLDFSFSNRWNKKSSMRLSSTVFTSGYFGDILNNVILRSRELYWQKGNPNLRSRIWWQTSFSNTWNISNKFSLTGRTIYSAIFHYDTPVWETIDGYDGVVSSTCDNSTGHKFLVGPRATLRLFNRNLVLTGDFAYNFQKINGLYDRFNSYWTGRIYGTWYVKNCYFGFYLIPPSTSYSDITRTYENWVYDLRFGYSFKNFNLKVTALNLFKEKMSGITTVNTEHYMRRRTSYSPSNRNSFNIELTYTFDYGKKVNRSTVSASGMLESGGMSVQ